MTNNNQKIIAAALAVVPFLLFADEVVFDEHEAEIVQVQTQTVQAKKEKPASKTPYIEYHNRMAVFAPWHQVYERIKPNAFYAGVEAYIVPVWGTGHRSWLADAELRMGYNFFWDGKQHMTPIAGVGVLEVGRDRHHHFRHKPEIVYGTLGCLMDYEFNSVFNLGANIKLLVGGNVHHDHHHHKQFPWMHHKEHGWKSVVWGYDLAIPFTFRFGRNRHWDFRLEPFNIFLKSRHSSRDLWGFRNTIGYRF